MSIGTVILELCGHINKVMQELIIGPPQRKEKRLNRSLGWVYIHSHIYGNPNLYANLLSPTSLQWRKILQEMMPEQGVQKISMH
ncbi:hypothetical protein C5167_024736 [Papaver somniferum]|uniref:Uncharacterized protein n=1 Tax=Papaver somniferum TaxID=3469 RepID=A0A4Y7JSR6_PAPSO|nr:hypothetical protein C5167_024736 [Papaver somniferum]